MPGFFSEVFEGREACFRTERSLNVLEVARPKDPAFRPKDTLKDRGGERPAPHGHDMTEEKAPSLTLELPCSEHVSSQFLDELGAREVLNFRAIARVATVEEQAR